MKDGLEILGASAFVSLLALAIVPSPSPLGNEGAGDQGADTVSVAAASASVAQMVETWDRPPEVDTALAALAPPAMPSPAQPAQVQPQQAPTTSLPLMRRQALAAPPVSQAPKAPEPITRAPDTSLRPAPRPAREVAAPKPQPQQPQAPKQTQRQQTPKPPSATASAPRVQKQAQGSGNGASQGQSRQTQQASMSPAKRSSLISRWGGQIQSRIARRAPKGAGKGTATVRIKVAANGALVSASLAKSSGNAKIDQLALQAVRSAGGFPKAPNGVGKGPFSFNIPIRSR